MAQASFGRKWLAGIIRNDDLSPEEKEQQIMEGHIAVTDGLKDKIEGLQAEADKAADLQKQLDGLSGGEDYKKKYESTLKELEDFKKQTASEAEQTAIKAAYRKMLIGEGISEKRIDAIMKVTDFKNMKRDKDGNLDNADALKKSIAEEWGEFKTTVTQKGAEVSKPPQTGKATKTKEEIDAIKDTAERQKAIAENHELFGF